MYVVGIAAKDMCYVWDTDDLTIEKVNMSDVGLLIGKGVHFSNVLNEGITEYDLKSGVRYCLVTRINYRRKPNSKKGITKVIQVVVSHPPVRLISEKFITDDIAYILTMGDNPHITLWYKDILYTISIRYNEKGFNAVHRIVPYAIGKYRGDIRIVSNSLNVGMKNGILIKKGKLFIAGDKSELEGYSCVEMSRKTFNRKFLLGDFK